MPNSVKFFDSTMPNSPVLNGQVGALVSLLDACLVNGFGSVAISSMIIADDVATVTTSAPHGFSMAGLTGPVVKISGASITAVNTEWRVTSVTNTTKFLIAMPGVTGPVSGTMSVKYAPLGWTKPFAGINKAAYKGNAQSNGHYLRVLDDSTVPTTANGRWANIRGFEYMTSVDDGTGLFPTAAQAANALKVQKSNLADATPRQWALVGDGELFYLFTFPHASSTYMNLAAGYCFGKVGSLRPADAFDTLIVGDDPADLTLPSYPGDHNKFSSLGSITSWQTGRFLARSHTQLGGSLGCGFVQPMGAPIATMGYGGIAYPCPVNSGLIVSPIALCENSLPRNLGIAGLYSHWHNNVLSHLDVLDNITGVSDRTLRCYGLSYNNGSAQCLIDITGPWR